jgi:hypothetical protein
LKSYELISFSFRKLYRNEIKARSDERKKYEIEDEIRKLVMGRNAVGGTACGGERRKNPP